MLRNFFYFLLFISLAYLLFINEDAKIIITGIAIFLIGMIFMEDGFKLFSGGLLEKILAKATNNTPKAIFTGFLSTSVVQSSSLISVIVISFLSAGLISLSGAIGVVFGSNIGTTTTAWIVSSFGVKINIAVYAFPMIIFGVILRFSKNKAYTGLGNVLLGLGFVFLGISYMKDGFETLKAGLDLSQFAMQGYLGVFVYVGIGALATIIIQSSSATMALIITALVTNQILYINALELSIGANIGTTVTAVMAAISSNSNGKRLAIAHLIFNIVTGIIAILFLYQLADLVTLIAAKIGISEDNYAMKLALFHTIFNILGVLVVSPFTNKLEKFLKTLFKDEKTSILKAKYLDDVVIAVPDAAIKAIKDETIHLYENSIEVISHALYLHRHKYLGSNDISLVVKNSNAKINVDINEFYSQKIKSLYGEIIHFSVLAQENMDEDFKNKIYNYKLASRDIVEAIKYITQLHKNLSFYLKSDNPYIKEEYNNLRINIAKTINIINDLRNNQNDITVLSTLNLLKEDILREDDLRNSDIDTLIRDNNITSKMATSLINDLTYTHNISKKLIEVATILWIEDKKNEEIEDDL
ncbi:Na/Pi cotransporter family protein [Poseidonibacter ostreae]|jgi:phosphate:Na+ symporter|uniref:Na/Pi cotransporter family protein n=1 Tax=Poseidonibacter ostreae TaxID=2654171 RepID=A0A6L4WR64_9BACT|nr:Na/Pi symporter [Poseidonibacter ostreae]KAB7884555.1 Na/Pi cotransporter family protein [Poseidonibacter ostreae]KAB7886971.1 Na/Pi cotransporter family protein [Poseidonibacter ostreae]KAB7887217.1 Na/Pi cotransporter family protein [Poseidonibacter ostreae]MAC84722.1 sodium:pantothenate symporter [Arcobacter sp.]|tara:strand:- start:6593 stop:8347 length:1755 start_codon:yes stop_codon:yes gene_type:complete